MATKKVRMTVKISGTRDGIDWPNPGEFITLPADEADALIGNRQAVDPNAAPVEEQAIADSLGIETATTTVPRKSVRGPRGKATETK